MSVLTIGPCQNIRRLTLNFGKKGIASKNNVNTLVSTKNEVHVHNHATHTKNPKFRQLHLNTQYMEGKTFYYTFYEHSKFCLTDMTNFTVIISMLDVINVKNDVILIRSKVPKIWRLPKISSSFF